MSGDIFSRHCLEGFYWHLYIETGTILNFQQCCKQLPKERKFQPQISIMLRRRNLALIEFHRFMIGSELGFKGPFSPGWHSAKPSTQNRVKQCKGTLLIFVGLLKSKYKLAETLWFLQSCHFLSSWLLFPVINEEHGRFLSSCLLGLFQSVLIFLGLVQ